MGKMPSHSFAVVAIDAPFLVHTDPPRLQRTEGGYVVGELYVRVYFARLYA